jgi:hypothetical protein
MVKLVDTRDLKSEAKLNKISYLASEFVPQTAISCWLNRTMGKADLWAFCGKDI